MSILEQEKFRSYTLQQRRASIALEPRDIQLKKLQEKLVDFFSLKQMITMNAIETIHLLWIEMNMDLKYLINIMRQAIYGRKLVMFIISNIVS